MIEAIVESPAESNAPAPALRRRGIYSLWNSIPIRWQILAAVAATSILVGALASVVAIYDSRARASIETRAQLDLWEGYIKGKASTLKSARELEDFLTALEQEMARLRHIDARILHPHGGWVSVTGEKKEDAAPTDEPLVPQWFVDLVQPNVEVRRLGLMLDSTQAASVELTARPDDEIAEAWELLWHMALLWIGGTMAMMGGLYFVIGHILGPMVSIASGMRELEHGHYGVRLPSTDVQELSSIPRNFNLLASALERAEADNRRLYQQLVAVQEDERRTIAADLHDEFGPCIFGITANAGSIARHAAKLPEPQSAVILSSVEEINTIADRLRKMNRALLARLRPVAIGRVTLQELLSDLISTFEQSHPDVRIERRFALLQKSFGEAVDLTIYRCLQEGLTNALRHGGATNVVVTIGFANGIDEVHDSGEPGRRAADLDFSIADNGTGIAATTPLGFGLSAMRERVKLLSGSFAITPIPSGGTELAIRIPISMPTTETFSQ